MKQVNVKKLILPNIPYVFIALLATKVSEAVRLAPGSDASTKLLNIMTGLNTAFHSLVPSFHPIDLCVGAAAAIAIRLAVYIKGKNAKKFRKNLEYGSARWGTAEDIKPYVDPAFENNIILTQTERLTMNSRPKDPKTARNKNVLIVGGSGSGKTRFWLKPNLLQCTSKTYPTSFVVTDPKGDIVVSCGHALQKNGYQIKILNSLNFKKSMHYNPFAYIHSEKDILKLVTTLIANTKGEGKAGDDFWVKAETLLYTALIGYIHYEAPVEEQNFSTLIEFINAMEVREDDEDFKNPVDLMFDELKKCKPDHFAVRQYAKFKLSAGKTAKSILISCGARLAPFDIQELRELTAYDELQLDTLGDRKTALFIIMSDTDDTFNFLISMCYTQLFNLLCEKADDVYGGRLPVHVRCLIDEAANIGQIPRLEKLVATIRSREISCCLVLQAQSQLKALYKDSADTIIGNMDCSIFLGGKEPGTLKELAAALGKETIDSYNTGESRGREVSHSLNYQKLGKELKELRASLETINKTASELITDIDRHFAEICKERGIDREDLAAAEQPSVEAQEVEKLYMVDNDKYIHVQRSDTGIDYTIYDAGSAKVLDGGVLDGTEQQLSTAALEVCKLHNIGEAAPIRLAPLELLKDLREANELPLDAAEQITGAVAVPTDAADTMLPELEQAVPMPDPTLTVDDMRSYGYLDSDMLPLSKDRAVELLEHDITVYMLYPDNAEEMVFEAEDIIKHDGMFGVTRPDWDAVKGHIPPRDVEQRFLNSPTDSMAIYQLRRDAPVELRFANLGSLAAPPDPANYEAVYTREVYPDDDTGRILENFYYIFNDERPGDFVGHSLSVSDIVALKQDGKVSYHYCDSMGFQELPAFQKPENYLKAAEMSMEDDYGMIDGIINNGPKQPTVADLEAQVKAGMSISLMDLAEAAHREKKKSVLEQLKSQPAQERPHKTAPKKSAEKEL